MIKVGIVYFSATGATDILAHEIGQGVCSIDDASAEYFRITKDLLAGGRFRGDTVLTGLGTCDAIIFGSPTYMGGWPVNLRPLLIPLVSSGVNSFGQTSWQLDLPVAAHLMETSPARYTTFLP